MTSLTKKELLAQSLARHHVLQRVSRLQVVSDLCGLQAQFATGPREALRIRARDYTRGRLGPGACQDLVASRYHPCGAGERAWLAPLGARQYGLAYRGMAWLGHSAE